MGFFIKKIGIVGVGLLGGSIAKGCKKHGIAKEVIGFGQNPQKIKRAKDLGLIDQGYSLMELSKEDVLAQIDLLVLAVPVQKIIHFLESILTNDGIINEKCTITDVGSAKSEICDFAWNMKAGNNFIGSHPMAGKEKSGFKYSDPELYKNASVFICHKNFDNEEKENLLNLHKEHLDKVRKFWKALGANISLVEPSYHDFIVAQTSHLPHILSAALVAHLGKNDKLTKSIFKEGNRWYGSGLLDVTRIAKGSPEMWLDIFKQNSKEITHAIDLFTEELQGIKSLLINFDLDKIHNYLEKSAKLREKLN